MTGGPTKSWVLNWTSEHLQDAEGKVAGSADQLKQGLGGHLDQSWNPGGTDWRGQTNNAAVEQAQNGVTIANRITEVKDKVTKLLSDAAHEGDTRKRLAADIIGEAEQAGYMVSEDLTQEMVVTDTKKCSNSSESDHRALAAVTYSRAIKQRANDLWATEQDFATKLNGFATQIQTHQFPAPGAPGAPDASNTGKRDSASTTAASVGALDDTVGKVNSGALLPKSPLDSGYYDMSTPEGRAMAAKARQLLIDNGKSPADADKLIKVLTTPSPAGSAEKNAPPTRAPGPQSGSEAFGEQWDQTERGVRSLLGQNGGDAAKDAWSSLIEGANKTMNPALQGLDAPDTAKALLSEGQLAVDNPRAFAGKHALDAAALIAGGPLGAEGLGALGEGRLALGAEDLGGAHGLHDAAPTTHTPTITDHSPAPADHSPPTGHLPPTGEPGTFGYDADGNRMPYANSRPPYAVGQEESVWNNSREAQLGQIDQGNLPLPKPGPDQQWLQLHPNGPTNPDWVVQDGHRLAEWRPGDPRQGVWDMGHGTGLEYRDLRQLYLGGDISYDEFMATHQDPLNYSAQDPYRNRSHIDEAPR